jgi:L-rhamnose mutarotase
VAAHAEVWPELRRAISDAGIRNYTIFLHGNQAFGYLESDDLDHAWEHLAGLEVNQRWQDAMADLLDARRRRGPALLPEIFRLD